jgi:ECF sigma factor
MFFGWCVTKAGLSWVDMSNLTQVLQAIDGGDARATDRLLPLVHEECRVLAARQLAQERPGQSLDASALVQTQRLPR